ncbi:MAG: ATP-binding protein, partial [Candidatus Aminicenantales bacterium]
VAVFGTLNIYFNRQSTYRTLQAEADKMSLFLAKGLAERSVKWLLHEDFISLQQVLDQTKDSNMDISYGFITDSEGRITAHTFGSTFPVELIRANQLKEGESHHIQIIQDENGHLYRDVIVPILEGKLGFLRLGITEGNLIRTTNRVVLILTGMVLIFLVIGIAGAIVFASWITNPITKMSNVFETIDLNGEFRPLRIETKDEINILANKFNEMALRLQKAHDDLKQAQMSLLRAEKLASIGTLASGIAHEINSPLAGLKNCLVRIKKNPQETQINRYFNLMMNAIQKVEKVIIGLLNFSRREDFIFKPFDLHQSIERALSLVEYKLERSGIEVKKSYDGKLNECYGDGLKIEQVIVNLVLNAIDAMPEGGKLFISSRASDSKVSLEIRDTGVGIAPDNLGKIFDPFFTTKEPGKGTGLGLSVSYNIIKEHGGDISVDSMRNKGTRFIIILPLQGKGIRE